jgi:hypothetical protein
MKEPAAIIGRGVAVAEIDLLQCTINTPLNRREALYKCANRTPAVQHFRQRPPTLGLSRMACLLPWNPQ